MEVFLLKLLELSLWASVLTVVILGIRLVFRKISAKYVCILWMIVAVRLIIPFSFESSVAPLRSVESFFLEEQQNLSTSQMEVKSESTRKDYGAVGNRETVFTEPIPGADSNEEAEHYTATITAVPEMGEPQNAVAGLDWKELLISAVPVIFCLWLSGSMLLFMYGGISCLKVKRMVKNAILYKDNVWLREGLESPFLFGWVHPKIYLPTNLEETQIQYVIEHEKSHIARGDHFAKLAGYALLSVYWFNPFIWVAYVMFCRDVERACDERVIVGYGVEDRKGYAEALLECSAGCGFAISHPLAFGEMDVKKRIGGILKYQKPGKWLTVVAVVLCVLSAAGCFMVQKAGQDNQNSQQFEVSPTPQLTIPPAEATPTVAPSSEERGNGPATPIPTPMEAAPTLTISAGTPTPLPPSDLELLGKVTTESAMAVPMGQTISVDLDGDGNKESVTFGIKGYEGEVSYMEARRHVVEDSMKRYFLQIDDTVLSGAEIDEEYWGENPGFTTYYIFDINTGDKYKELGIYFNGPSGDPCTALYRYVEGRLYCVGTIQEAPLESDYSWNSTEYEDIPYLEMVTKVNREKFQITVLGDGSIWCEERTDVLETTCIVRKYELWNASFGKLANLKEIIRDRYEFTGWKTDRQESNVRARMDFMAYAQPMDLTAEKNTENKVFIPEGTRISFYAYYPDNGWTAGWIQFAYGENLDSFAWFYKGVDPTGKFLLYFPEETVNWPEDIFENLSHAG